MSRNFGTQGCELYGVKRIKHIVVEKENNGGMFEAPLFYLK